MYYLSKKSIFVALFCLLSVSLINVPAVHGQTKQKSKTKSSTKQQSNTANGQLEKIHTQLESFGKNIITSINRCIIPSQQQKSVVKNNDGTFTARYLQVDPTSLKTSFKKPESSTAVTYIGFLDYDEIEYSCTAKTRQEAMNGSFTVTRREPLRELIKYRKGKWTY